MRMHLNPQPRRRRATARAMVVRAAEIRTTSRLALGLGGLLIALLLISPWAG